MPSNRPKCVSQRPVIVNTTPCDRSRRALSRHVPLKRTESGMSRHRCLPRATLSTNTPLQSPRKDILRQHFAKTHYADPVRPTPSSRTRSSRTTNHVIPSVSPRHPELVSGSSSRNPCSWSSPDDGRRMNTFSRHHEMWGYR